MFNPRASGATSTSVKVGAMRALALFEYEETFGRAPGLGSLASDDPDALTS